MIETKGKIYYPDYSIPINYYENLKALYLSNTFECYRILYIEDGIGSMLINKRNISVLPLTLYCLNEKDQIEEFIIEGGRIHLICFLPSSINSKLSLDKMNTDEELTVSESQDKLLFIPFIMKEKALEEGILLNVDTGRRLKEILMDLKVQLFTQNDSWPCISRSYLIELLILIYRTSKIHKEYANKETLVIQNVINYMSNNYMHKITIDELSKYFNTNRTTLSKEFKAASGETIINYLMKIRIQVAAVMLRDTALSIAFIIERVGFKNITHFNKIFKQYMLYLPHEYRKKFN